MFILLQESDSFDKPLLRKEAESVRAVHADVPAWIWQLAGTTYHWM